ncbi:hypothetical protein BV25DRAFT_1841569 [Artomyces pyxidatus]|uniref:Uncharacterized protein n=1 Tax=Artomyces pyxidatus TaxID=48021 RepID=A0ACB8SME0_9AGAM|nr:hypothetical protein BV25DRAFT_1841569 [Artomyces pyxidatus]
MPKIRFFSEFLDPTWVISAEMKDTDDLEDLRVNIFKSDLYGHAFRDLRPSPIAVRPASTVRSRVQASQLILVEPTSRLSDNADWIKKGHFQLVLQVATREAAPGHPQEDLRDIKGQSGRFQPGRRPICPDMPANSVTVTLAGQLGVAAMGHYTTERERETACRPIYEDLLRTAMEQQINLFRGMPDAVASVELPEGQEAYYMLDKWKVDLNAGRDGNFELGVTYVRLVHSPEVSDFSVYAESISLIVVEYERVANACCCPCILIAVIGPYLFVFGAVLVEVPIIQQLADPMLLGDDAFPGDRAILAAAELRAYYSSITPSKQVQPSRFHPNPTYVQPNLAPQNLVFDQRFNYAGRNSSDYRQSLFEAKLGEDGVLVKICERYGEAAHRALAAHDLAPRLHFCVELAGNGVMAVMDRLAGQSLWATYKERELPARVKSDVRKALDILHAEGPVFGDLRRNNIVTVPRPQISNTPQAAADGRHAKMPAGTGAMLVDFDWAGKAGVDRYPL